MNDILNVLKFCCKALNFIRNLVMNFVFLLFVLALVFHRLMDCVLESGFYLAA